MLWLTPAMDRLFADAASGRRRFLDRLVLALRPDHAMHSARYDAAMRARNKLLAEDGPWDEAWLAALEARMAEHGAAIAEARAATVEALAERLAAAPEGPFARALIALEGGGAADLAASPVPRRRRRPHPRRPAPRRPARHPCRPRTSPPRSARPASRRRC